MGKLARFASVKSAQTSAFVYVPPLTAFDATRTLIMTDLGYEQDTVDIEILGRVLRGLRRANPHGRILVVGGAMGQRTIREIFTEDGVLDLLDDNMRAAATQDLLMRPYQSLQDEVVALDAPEYVADYECLLTVSRCSPLETLRSLLSNEGQQRERSTLEDVYFTIGHYFHGAVLQAAEKVFWGDDLLITEEATFQQSKRPIPDYLTTIQQRG